jgi:hypothetical protein
MIELTQDSSALKISKIEPYMTFVKSTCFCDNKEKLVALEFHSLPVPEIMDINVPHICNLEKSFIFDVPSFLSERVRLSYTLETSLRICLKHSSVVSEILMLTGEIDTILTLSRIFKDVVIC